ncbi:MAG: hypothetical protein J7480_03155 [Microbacteriaceae bacterium]|nr:hypothetical protein [Microbacteriaceae bacterium]
MDATATSTLGTIADILGIASFVVLALGVLWLFWRPFPKLSGARGMFTLDNRNGATVSSFAWRMTILRDRAKERIPGHKGVVVPMREFPYGDAVHIRVDHEAPTQRTPDGRPRQVEERQDPYTPTGWAWTVHLEEGQYLLLEFSWQNPVFPLFRMRRIHE